MEHPVVNGDPAIDAINGPNRLRSQNSRRLSKDMDSPIFEDCDLIGVPRRQIKVMQGDNGGSPSLHRYFPQQVKNL
jgi:hypothetical protein